MRANEPGAHLSCGARYMIKGGNGNASDHRQGLSAVSIGENQRDEQEMWGLVPALPLNTWVNLDKSLFCIGKSFLIYEQHVRDHFEVPF